MKGIIYKATNINSGKCYIGETIQPLYERRQQHYLLAKREQLGLKIPKRIG
jgi:hypothetical protein